MCTNVSGLQAVAIQTFDGLFQTIKTARAGSKTVCCNAKWFGFQF